MKIIFPKPVTKKTVWITAENACWEEIEKICKEQGITQEQVINTFLNTAWQIYQQENKPGAFLPNQKQIEKMASAIMSSQDFPAGIPTPKKKESSTDKYAALRLNGRWARKYDACIECNGTEHKHFGGGLCSVCYMKKGNKKPIVSQGPAEPPVAEKPYILGVAETRRKEHNERFDKHIESKVVTCALIPCLIGKKFIKGMGITYKGKEFCGDQCVETVVNQELGTDSIASTAEQEV